MNIHRTNDLLRTAEQNVKNEERLEERRKVHSQEGQKKTKQHRDQKKSTFNLRELL